MAEKRHDSPRHLDFDPDRQQQQNDGDDRTVDNQQNHEDHYAGDSGDLQNRIVAAALHIRNQRSRAGEVDAESGRRRRPVHDIPDRRHGLVTQSRTLVARQVQLHDTRTFDLGSARPTPSADLPNNPAHAAHVSDRLVTHGPGRRSTF